jgi:aspartyl protease family protein
MRKMKLRAVLLLFLFAPCCAIAADIHVVALTAGKAVVKIDGGRAQTLTVGQVAPEGVKLISATSESAEFEVGGKRRTLAAGEGGAIATVAAAAGRTDSVTLTADARGHFVTTAVVNGTSLRFIVDTGATSVVLSGADAKRAGIHYANNPRSVSQTANGVVPVYAVKIDRLKLGDIEITNVDAVVMEGERLPIGLLGMSFLNRMEMRREGQTMVLIRRF